MADNLLPEDFSMILYLPDEVLRMIFGFCSARSLGRLAATCTRFRDVIYDEDNVWKNASRNVIGSNMSVEAMQNRCKPILTYRDRCRISKVWRRRLGHTTYIKLYDRCMPWMVLEQDFFYCSSGKSISQYRRNNIGNVFTQPVNETRPLRDDISKFAANGTELVCARRDGLLSRYNKYSLTEIQSVYGHKKDVLTVDVKDDIVVSGSKDSSLKIWRIKPNDMECLREISVGNRVLSTSILPSKTAFLVGTPGTNDIHPLQLFDLETAHNISEFGEDYRYGAGILDMFPETPHTFFSCGYDTTLRLWDTRSPLRSVLMWEEPCDSSLYCVETDYNVTMLTGTANNGAFIVWDKRITRRTVKLYNLMSFLTPDDMLRLHHRDLGLFFCGPVYSIAFDAAHIYVAFQRAVVEYSYL